MTKYKKLESAQISPDLFHSFNRYQKVERCWRKEDGGWVLKDIAFEENWNADNIEFLVSCLKNTVATGGTVIGAFQEEILIGFSSLENQPFGEVQEYLQLSSLHVSCEQRGSGIGKQLFRMAADCAREKGAKKLYISAHPSEETQLFYKSMKCVETLHYFHNLPGVEPDDCQLEYVF